MGFKPGESGNPKGRPPKGRALAEALLKAGNKKITNRDGVTMSRRDVLAEMLWQAATEGTVDFHGGGLLVVDSMQEWFTIGKFVHQHLDGPVRPEIELPGAGNISFQLSVVDRRKEPDEDADPDGEED